MTTDFIFACSNCLFNFQSSVPWCILVAEKKSIMKKLLLVAILMVCNVSFAQWEQVGGDIDGTTEGALFGWSLVLSDDGNTMVVSSRGDSSTGTPGFIQAYSFDGAVWTPFGNQITDESTTPTTGIPMALNAAGTVLALGFPQDNSGDGSVDVYAFDGANWVQQGNTISNVPTSGYLGGAVALSETGQRLVVGAQFTFIDGVSSGEVRVYDFNGVDWELVGSPILNDQGLDSYGAWVDISDGGGTIATASQGQGNGNGFVQVYQFDGTDWAQQGQTLSGAALNDRYGENISISGDGSLILFGAPGDDSVGGFFETYTYDGTNWVLFGSQLSSDDTIGNFYGRRNYLSPNGQVLVVTEFLSAGEGRIYTYDRTDSGWDLRDQRLEGTFDFDYVGWDIALDENAETLVIAGLNGLDQFGYVRTYKEGALSIDEFEGAQIALYPNPAKDVIQLSGLVQDRVEEISIYNQLGQRIKTLKRANATIDVSSLPSGMYYLRLKTTNGLSSKKFIKN